MHKINLELIKSRRNELNISMQSMAEKIGRKNGSTWMKYENGEYVFDANHLPIICKELNLELKDLYFFEEDVAKSAINKKQTC